VYNTSFWSIKRIQYYRRKDDNLLGSETSDGFYGFAVAVGRQSAMHTENSRFASPTLGQHISRFRGYRILFSIRNPYTVSN
jgi:hypothetical protein